MAFPNYKKKLADAIDFDEATDSDFDGTDSDFDVKSIAQSVTSTKYLKVGQGQGMMRKPTRVPNPKIQNRNALLARENRQRKKEYVEELEQKIQHMQDQNRQLKKMMKQKNGEIATLENDRAYLKSLLMNKTEIFSILKSIQNAGRPITSESTAKAQVQNVNVYKRNSLHSSRSSMSTASTTPSSDDNNDYGLDMDAMTPQSINGWDNLLGELEPQKHHVYCTNNNKIESEHNYFESDFKFAVDDEEAEVKNPGICLHITNNRVSLEFCASCHQQAQAPSWIDNEDV